MKEWRNYVIAMLVWLLLLEIFGETFAVIFIWAIMILGPVAGIWVIVKLGRWFATTDVTYKLGRWFATKMQKASADE